MARNLELRGARLIEHPTLLFDLVLGSNTPIAFRILNFYFVMNFKVLT